MRTRQHGLILPALLVLLLIGGMAAMLGGNTLAEQVIARRQQATMAELARARAALIAYAQSYPFSHPGQTVGYLPCPDTDSASGDGNAAGVCGSAGNFAVGRLPYRTLGMSPLRDGDGECLWYAVAGPFKNNPKGPSMDWDTPGQFEITDTARPLNPAAHADQRAAAVVFSPGRPLSNQARTASGPHRCGGNANAALALQAYLESAATAPTSSQPVSLPRGRPASASNNDALIWLSADDIFDARLLVRSDFVAAINNMNTRLQAAVTHHPQPAPTQATPVGLVDVGTFPAPMTPSEVTAYETLMARALTSDEVAANDTLRETAPWHGQYRYLRCRDGSACLSWADDTGIVRPCVAIVAFAGHRLDSQNRADGIADTEAYFEGPNISAITTASTFTGPATYAGTAPTTDVIRCIP
ncbi:MAG: hypothetical protein DWQ11_13240 [Proteobacteria bacterium]|nr:MAG: hypothetical protein DWQ11_13240 [Pseudomonadota bacterium]